MPSLLETQALFAKGIMGGAAANDLIAEDWLKAEQRIAIYRHHYRATLREALAATFPVIAKLVGEGFFNGMAGAFTAAHPPSAPCVAEYGGEFPGFIAGFAPAQALPYLSDVALLEWLMNDAANLRDYPGRAFYSRYPVGRIWETNQEGFAGDPTVSLDEGGGWFVVEKNGGKVFWRWLDLPPDAFDPKE